MTHSLAGQTALVTGATRGIGRAISFALAGAHVIVVSRKGAAVDETVNFDLPSSYRHILQFKLPFIIGAASYR